LAGEREELTGGQVRGIITRKEEEEEGENALLLLPLPHFLTNRERKEGWKKEYSSLLDPTGIRCHRTSYTTREEQSRMRNKIL